MKYLWKCIFCVPSQNNKYLLSVYFAFPHKIIHMEYLRRLRLKVLTGLEYHLPLNRPHSSPSIELLCVLFLLLQGPFMVQNFPQTSLQTAKTSLQTAKTSLQTSKTRLFFLFSFFATEYLFTSCLFRNGCSLFGTYHSFVARAHIVRRCAPIHVISHSPYSFATWLL